MNYIIRNIKRLVQVREPNVKVVKGEAMKELPFLEDAFLVVRDGNIASCGFMANINEHTEILNHLKNAEDIDASGKLVLPAWCDSHTHIVFADWREAEFRDKISGLSYEDIAKRGGGILNSAAKLAAMPQELLLEQAIGRIKEIEQYGTGAVEIKSGYGLTVEAELKMLRVIQELKKHTNLTIKATFLGAHTYPKEFQNNHQGYLELLVKEMLPAIAKEGLADYCDVFCDKGFFSAEETDKILKAAILNGLKPKLHANELGNTGGIQVGVANKAVSVDHLEHTGEEEIKTLLNSDTMPTLLPSTAFFLGLQYAPARKMIDAGLPVALLAATSPSVAR